MIKLAKAQKPDLGRTIANMILEETDKRKSQRGEEIEGQEKEREQIDISHDSYIRRQPVPLSRCQPTRYFPTFSCEIIDGGNYGVFQRVPCTGRMPSRFSDSIPEEAFESYQIDHKRMDSTG